MPRGIISTTGDPGPWYVRTANTTSTTTSSTVWYDWVNSAQTITSASTSIWTTWTTAGTASSFDARQPAASVQTPEQIAESNARALRWQIAETERLRRRAEAAERAKALLVANLSPIQRGQFYKLGAFVVEGKNGFRYRIREGRSGNVDMVKPDGTIQHRLCAHPRADVPNFDTMLAQKLTLETDEDSFLRIANRHPVLTPEARVLEPLH